MCGKNKAGKIKLISTLIQSQLSGHMAVCCMACGVCSAVWRARMLGESMSYKKKKKNSPKANRGVSGLFNLGAK